MRYTLCQEVFVCENPGCFKPETNQKVIERDWCAVQVSEHRIKDFCCKECRDAFAEENYTPKEKAETEDYRGIKPY